MCNGQNEWSEWFNIDDPSGDGDLEFYSLFEIGCKNPLNIQVETLDGTSFNQTGQIVHLDKNFGFMCLNNENNNSCFDYRFRQCCIKPRKF